MFARPLLASLAAAWLVGCGDSALTLADLADEASWPAVEPAPAALRRLTQAQYDNVLHDLFGEALVVPPLAEPDLVQGGLTAVGASAGTFSPRGVESAEASAFALAAQLVQPGPLRDAWVDCDPAEEACLRALLERTGRRLYRRPLTDAEIGRALTVAATAASALGTPDAGLEFALATLLQSPHFLFRTELGASGATRELTGVELASRLAFFLWNSAPDDALLDAALAGELDTREGLFSWASRMLDDARARRGIRAYFDDQLGLHELDALKKDPFVFEAYNPALGPDAREETLASLEYTVLDADIDFRDVMTTRETFLSPYLASVYGLPAPSPEGFTRVELPEAAGRSGLLGQASFLALHAHSVSSSATRRGKAVRTILLCQEIPAPPVNVDTSIPEPSGNAPTLRDRVAEHLEVPSCAGCHKLMDPIGLALENYDGLGAWRDLDNGTPIDATGDLDGVAFDGPEGLAVAIREHPDFVPCAVRTLARYATGQVEPEGAKPGLDLLASRFGEAHEHRMRPLLLELVMSPLFRRVSAPEASP